MSRAELIETFAARNTAVQSNLPPDRLLVYEVKAGWDPLCEFLGKERSGTTFPTSNNREEFWGLAKAVTG